MRGLKIWWSSRIFFLIAEVFVCLHNWKKNELKKMVSCLKSFPIEYLIKWGDAFSKHLCKFHYSPKLAMLTPWRANRASMSSFSPSLSLSLTLWTAPGICCPIHPMMSSLGSFAGSGSLGCSSLALPHLRLNVKRRATPPLFFGSSALAASSVSAGLSYKITICVQISRSNFYDYLRSVIRRRLGLGQFRGLLLGRGGSGLVLLLSHCVCGWVWANKSRNERSKLNWLSTKS